MIFFEAWWWLVLVRMVLEVQTLGACNQNFPERHCLS